MGARTGLLLSGAVPATPGGGGRNASRPSELLGRPNCCRGGWNCCPPCSSAGEAACCEGAGCTAAAGAPIGCRPPACAAGWMASSAAAPGCHVSIETCGGGGWSPIGAAHPTTPLACRRMCAAQLQRPPSAAAPPGEARGRAAVACNDHERAADAGARRARPCGPVLRPQQTVPCQRRIHPRDHSRGRLLTWQCRVRRGVGVVLSCRQRAHASPGEGRLGRGRVLRQRGCGAAIGSCDRGSRDRGAPPALARRTATACPPWVIRYAGPGARGRAAHAGGSVRLENAGQRVAGDPGGALAAGRAAVIATGKTTASPRSPEPPGL
jgi:hypothetical protein